MGKVVIDCRNCNKIVSIEIDEIQDVFEIVCPECGSEDVWIRDIELDDEETEDIILGKGGCGQK